MQQEKNNEGHDDSDNDEGFVVNALQIKHKDSFLPNNLSQARPQDFQPRYITVHNLIRKQMPETVCSFPHFPNNEQPDSQYFPRKKLKQQLMHPQERYFNSKDYRLVYQRITKKLQSDDSYSRNDVTLASVVSYSSENYSAAKAWEMRPSNEDLTFQSKFECGNLMLAFRSLVQINSYTLFMQNDTNTKGYNKWFYFAVRNTKRNTNYTFNIVNFKKNFTFFRQGLKPTRFSLMEHRATGNGWSKYGKNIQFYRSQLNNKQDSQNNQYYTLSFQASFDHLNDVSLFSLLPPYSYSRLTNFLLDAKKTSLDRNDLKLSLSTIAYTLTNTQVPYITISSHQASKKNILILARQHPGQVWSSFLAESIIRELIRQSSGDREWLLKNYTFRIFPMVNVDGVIYGNFRCDLSGMDLNRCWKNPNKLLHSQIIAIKDEITRLSAEEQIVSCLDLHSHSKDYNVFAYCCKTDAQGRLFPLLLSRNIPIFNFPSCTYGISKFKQSTARAVINEITNATDVLTIEASFFASNNPLKLIHPATFLSFANGLIKSLKQYLSKGKELMEAQQSLPKAMAEIAQHRAKNRQKYGLDESGSDSEPQCDEIDMSQKIGKILPKCSLVEISMGLKIDPNEKQKEQIQKIKALSPIKKNKKGSKTSKPESKTSTKYATIAQTIQTKVDKTPLINIKGQPANDFNKSILERVLKRRQRQSMNESIKNQKQSQTLQPKLSIRSHKNDSLDLVSTRQSPSKFVNMEFRSTTKQKESSRYEFHYKYQKKEVDEFPMLCVLSESKKQAHLQRLRRIHPTPPQRQKSLIRYQPTLVINKKLDTMERLRQRQKNSNDLITSIWRSNNMLHLQSPIKHVFYGGL